LKLDNDDLWLWLTSEWEQKNLISGRYDRNSHEGNGIESGAVYGIAAQLASLKGEDDLSRDWKSRGFHVVNPNNENFEHIHFFDLIWNAPL
jgi:hypothetical protein